MEDCVLEKTTAEDQPDQTHDKKLHPLEVEKLLLEIGKLRQEVQRLHQENSHWAALGRNIWPLVSGVLTIVVSLSVAFVTWKAQTFSAEEDKKKIFFSAVQMATDAKSSYDGRIAGIWTLSDYWHDPNYSTTVANTLAAVLVADPPTTGSEEEELKFQKVREAAADVIGTAIDENTATREANRIRTLLYGDGPKGQLGAVTVDEQNLAELEKNPQETNIASVHLKLQATREAIRKNWENLEYGDFFNHDLNGIKLYKADAKHASFRNAALVGANLCGADLTGADFSGTDLSNADLAGATLDNTTGWASAHLIGANIHSVKGAQPEFNDLAAKEHPHNQDFNKWFDSAHPGDKTLFTSCDKY